MRREGAPVEALSSFFLPEDELWYCIYEARSPDEVAEASRRADLELSWIQPAVVGEGWVSEHRAEPRGR